MFPLKSVASKKRVDKLDAKKQLTVLWRKVRPKRLTDIADAQRELLMAFGTRIAAIRPKISAVNVFGAKVELITTIQKTKYMKREVTSKNSYFGKRAIVVGAGLSGLSAARVLSDYFD